MLPFCPLDFRFWPWYRPRREQDFRSAAPGETVRWSVNPWSGQEAACPYLVKPQTTSHLPIATTFELGIAIKAEESDDRIVHGEGVLELLFLACE